MFEDLEERWSEVAEEVERETIDTRRGSGLTQEGHLLLYNRKQKEQGSGCQPVCWFYSRLSPPKSFVLGKDWYIRFLCKLDKVYLIHL